MLNHEISLNEFKAYLKHMNCLFCLLGFLQVHTHLGQTLFSDHNRMKLESNRKQEEDWKVHVYSDTKQCALCVYVWVGQLYSRVCTCM